jgi:molybdate transport system substrate-binding protein
MFNRWLLAVCALLALIPAACSNQGQPAQPSTGGQASASPSDSSPRVELIVSAAASLQDAMEDMKRAFEAEYPRVTLTFVFGSSGKLARQLMQGAPSDAFLSASAKDMDTLQEQNLIAADTRADFARNELVLIARKDDAPAIASFGEIDPGKIKHLAIGETKSVPAGSYAEETLRSLRLWDPLQSKLVMGSDVRQVLAYVESGNADLGIAYASDARVSGKVKVLASAQPEWHQPIVYPGAVLVNSSHPEEARAFIACLTGEKGKEIMKKYGFR